jgi:hypothetical protein
MFGLEALMLLGGAGAATVGGGYALGGANHGSLAVG